MAPRRTKQFGSMLAERVTFVIKAENRSDVLTGVVKLFHDSNVDVEAYIWYGGAVPKASVIFFLLGGILRKKGCSCYAPLGPGPVGKINGYWQPGSRALSFLGI